MRDGDSEEKEAHFLFEAVLSGCELVVSSPREAGVSASLKFWEPLIVPHCYFWSVVCKQEREEVRVQLKQVSDRRITQGICHPDNRWLRSVLPTV